MLQSLQYHLPTLAEYLFPDAFHAVEDICEFSNFVDIKLPMLEKRSFTNFRTQSYSIRMFIALVISH